jgi:hypothetical protein
MTKKEIIWREILHQVLASKKIKFTQKELASQFSFSLSTVFNALKVPRQAGAIKVSGRDFTVIDAEKFLNIWATFRRLKKDIIYQTHCNLSVREIEGLMPPKIIFGVFSAYLKKYKTAPADYDKVYVYVSEDYLPEIKKRFPFQKGYENLIVLKADPYLAQFGQITPDVQTYVDLWNLSEWYAKDFLRALKEKMFT